MAEEKNVFLGLICQLLWIHCSALVKRVAGLCFIGFLLFWSSVFLYFCNSVFLFMYFCISIFVFMYFCISVFLFLYVFLVCIFCMQFLYVFFVCISIFVFLYLYFCIFLCNFCM